MVRKFPVYNGQQYNSWAGSGGLEGGASVAGKTNINGVAEGFKSYVLGANVCQTIRHIHPFGVFYGENPLNYSFPLVLLEISSVIIATRLVRVLLKPLRQPKIVSDIIGGIIVGPSLLSRSKKFKAFVFPENSDFMIKNIGLLGFMYYLFISGVKMDMTLVTKSGKKHICIVLVSVFVPMLVVLAVGFFLRNSMDADLATFSSLGGFACAVSLTYFPVLYDVLKELNLLNSEVGRMALSIAIISDAMGIVGAFAYEYAKQDKKVYSNNGGFYMIVSGIFVFIFLIIVRKLIISFFVVRKRSRIDEPIIIAFLAAALAMGFVTDLFGLAIGNGPLWFGIVLPDGPPIGSTLVERTETFATHILMPFAFIFTGMYVDVSNVSVIWPMLKPVVAMTIIGYLTKSLSTFLSCLYFNLPWRNSLAISLTLSVRGQMEILIFIHWMDKRMLHPSYFTMLVLLTTLMTGIVTPLISHVYDPTKQYMTVNQKRTIQQTDPGADLHILLTIRDQKSVAGLVTLLEASNPTPSTPLSVTALFMMELIGRAAPICIDHDRSEHDVPPQYASCLVIHNVLSQFQESHVDSIKLHSYTIVTPKRTMYQDICERALINKATMIILPFNRDNFDDSTVGAEGERLTLSDHSINSFVLSNAPCSVGILIEKGYANRRKSSISGSCRLNIAVLFLGGADAREALAYADRMLGNPDVCLTVIRLLVFSGEGDDKMEKKLDDGMVTWFWVKNEGNERMLYKEVIVRNGVETVAAIKAINNDSFDLWIVGRKQGINPVFLDGLLTWPVSKNHQELGIIGDYIGSDDFGGNASVLVVQQHMIRDSNGIKD